MNNTIKISAGVLVNFAYPKVEPGVFATVKGYHESGLIVELAEPHKDGSLYKLVDVEMCSLLPERAPKGVVQSNGVPKKRKPYDTTGRRLVKDLMGLVYQAAKNDDPKTSNKYRFRIVTAESNRDEVIERLVSHGYEVEVVKANELLASPKSDDAEGAAALS